MSNHYFGIDRTTGEPIDPTRLKWYEFVGLVKTAWGITVGIDNFLWNKPRGQKFATNLSEIFVRSESHGTSAYGQTNNRLLYSEINENTNDLVEALEGNYFESTHERIALYLWDNTGSNPSSFSYNIYWSDDEFGIPTNASSIFTYQPKLIGIRKTDNCPHKFRMKANISDSDTYNFLEYRTDTNSIVGGEGYNTDTHEHDTVICNIPLFAQKSQALDYLENGLTIDNEPYLLNSVGEEVTSQDEPSKVYYYNMNLMKNGSTIAKRSFRIDILNGKIGAYKIEGNDPWNIGFLAQTSKVIKVIYQDSELGTIEYNSWSEFITRHGDEEWSYIEYTLGTTSEYYETNVTTNISLWKDRNDAQLYLNNQLSIEDSLSQGKNLSTLAIRTGQNVDKTQNNSVSVSGSNRAYKISESDLDGICGELWTTDTDVWSEILEGTHVTNNPIDFIVNCFKFPFSISNYCTMGSVEDIRLGGRRTGVHCATIVGVEPVEIASAFIKPIFNNFLDYSNVNLFLYLPYCGLSQLDFKMVISTQLTIDVVVDPFNGSMKYYVKSDGKLIEEHGCNVGMSVPLIGSDSASKSREIVDSQTQIINNIVGGTQGVTNAISSSVNIVNMMNQIESEPVMITKGNNSPSTGLCDVDYPFLIFDVQEAIQPELLYTKYGYPCNRIVQMNKCQGWCELNDIQLVGTMLEDEKSEIVSMMTSGVIF